MQCSLILFLCVYLAIGCVSLVSKVKLEKGAKGCKINTTEFGMWEMVKAPMVCGLYQCVSKNGDALIVYCQMPAIFAECKTFGVDTTVDFPQCCWMCTNWRTDCIN